MATVRVRNEPGLLDASDSVVVKLDDMADFFGASMFWCGCSFGCVFSFWAFLSNTFLL